MERKIFTSLKIYFRDKRFYFGIFFMFILQMALNDKEAGEIKKMKPHEMSNAEFVSKLMGM